MAKYMAPIKPIIIIQQLESAKTTKAKAKIIKQAWTSDSDEFFIGLDIALNPGIEYGLETVPEIQDSDDGSPGQYTFAEFLALTDKLSKKSLSDFDAKQEIVNAALKCNISEWNLWYRRILLKTLPKHLPMDVMRTTLIELTTQKTVLKSQGKGISI